MMARRLLERYGPTALITGASNGIGEAFAHALAAEGFSLILVARRKPVLDALAADIAVRDGVRVRTIGADLSAPYSVTELVSQTREEEVGLLVAAAGYGTSGAFVENGLGQELGMIDLNCRTVAELVHNYGGEMRDRGRGGIILLSSLVAFQGVPQSANYAATKAWVQTFAEGLRREVKPAGIDVLAVAPGPVASGFAERAGMTMAIADKPGMVARDALRALGRKGTVRPGRLGKLLELSMSPLPRRLRTRIMGRVMPE